MAKKKCALKRVCSDEVVIKRAGFAGSPEQHSAAIMRAAEGVYEYTKAVGAYEAHGDCAKAVQYGFNLSRNVGIYENEVKWEGTRPDAALMLAAENTLASVMKKCAPRRSGGLSSGFEGLGAWRKVTPVTADVTVHRDSSTGEYRARIKGRPEADYFTDTRADAEDTALAMAGAAQATFPVTVQEGMVAVPASARWGLWLGNVTLTVFIESAAYRMTRHAIISAQNLVQGWRELHYMPSKHNEPMPRLTEDSAQEAIARLDTFREKIHPDLKGL